MTRRMSPITSIGSNIKVLMDDNVESIEAGKAPPRRIPAYVPITPIIVNKTPNIIRFDEVFDILIDPAAK
jgi:hypothetical protein